MAEPVTPIMHIYGNRNNGLELAAKPTSLVEQYQQQERIGLYLVREYAYEHFTQIVLLDQVHGSEIHTIYGESDSACYTRSDPRVWRADAIIADAIITTVPAIVLAVLTADCVPLIVYHPHEPIVALVHVGWRGAIKESIVGRVIARIESDLGVAPCELQVRIGPAAGVCCYRVGGEFIEQLTTAVRMSCMQRRADGWYFDLVGFIQAELCAQGVKQQGAVAPACTICSLHYHSYRRDRERALRNVTLAWIRTLR